MEVRIDPHTLESARSRGVSENEIRETIATGSSIPARFGRLGRTKVFSFGKERLGRFYEDKGVEVIYTIEQGIVVTVTVYAFYGRWEN